LLELIVLETIRCKLGHFTLARLSSMVVWFSLLIYISYQYIEWSVSRVVMTLIVCSFVFIFVEPLGGS
jgi:membrane protein DedA with SNARE-associated domain